MSSEVGDQTLGALTEKGPKRHKGPQSICKNSKLPKIQHNVSQKGLFYTISGPLGPSQEMKFLGPGGDRSPPPPTVSQALLRGHGLRGLEK